MDSSRRRLPYHLHCSRGAQPQAAPQRGVHRGQQSREARGRVRREGNQTEQKVKNAASDAEFGVDLLRQAAQKTFPFVSKKSPNSIIHTTLVRLMSPDAFDEAALTRVREACQRISQQLTNSATSFVVDKLWYVDESHFIRPTGHTTTVSLGC
ncbi:hypothetical protein Pcac1_g6692 [Phytophthora cactorum]|nr:hypothetical protein Pcac1_g6692 [Phytophthora cactorum]